MRRLRGGYRSSRGYAHSRSCSTTSRSGCRRRGVRCRPLTPLNPAPRPARAYTNSMPGGGPPTTCRSADLPHGKPLLREPLRPDHIKPRLLGHWGTTPGLNFIYAHLNRAILARNLDMIYVMGPGHGGPGPVAAAWLEGTYSEIYPDVSQDESGMRRLFTQFSFPGGVPSHVAPETPGSIHEGGELGTRCPTRTALHSTTPTSWSQRSSETAKPKPDHSPRAGIPTNSSIRAATGPYFRSCTSTDTRSPIPHFSTASATTNSNHCFVDTDTNRSSSPVTNPTTCTGASPTRSIAVSIGSPRSSKRHGNPAAVTDPCGR